MYFEVNNTPENVKRKNKSAIPPELPVLSLAPFSSPPIVSFENILIGEKAIRSLVICNPKPDDTQIYVHKRPNDLNIELSWCENSINAFESTKLELVWCPEKIVGQRTSIQILDKKKGKYDIIIVCKSIAKKAVIKKGEIKSTKQVKVKKNNLKAPKQRSPKSRTSVYFSGIKKNENISKFLEEEPMKDLVTVQKPTNILKTRTHAFTEYNLLSNVEELDTVRRETYFIHGDKNLGKENYSYNQTPVRKNPFGKNKDSGDFSILSAIENLAFTPSKVYNSCQNDVIENKSFSRNVNIKVPPKKRKYFEKDLSALNEEICDHVNIENNLKIQNNITHSIIDLCDSSNFSSLQLKTTELTSNQELFSNQLNNENYYYSNGQQPVFSFSINDNIDTCFQTPNHKNILNDTLESFNPKRCSTERKVNALSPGVEPLSNTGNDLFEKYPSIICNTPLDATYGKMSSETYTKGDSPIVPLDPDNNENLHSSPYSIDKSPHSFIELSLKNNYLQPVPVGNNIKGFNERLIMRNNIRDKNNLSSVKYVIEANLWQRSPPRSISPTPLTSIPEEPSMIFSESNINEYNKRVPSETFILNRTFDTHNNSTKSTKTGWNKTAVNHEPKTKLISHSFRAETIQPRLKMYPEKLNYEVDVYSVASTIDPFLASTCLYDEEAFDRLEMEFKRWLNYLLTPPSDLDAKIDIDIGKAWLDNRSKAVPTAPTKEQVSSKYHTSHRLESLRKSANTLISSSEISQVFLKVSSQVERKLLTIRVDKNLHLDIGLQKTILSLLLCYNPLWLRIGLEALYGKVLPLSSNDDIYGLSDFIIENMFKNPYISAKHLLMQPVYCENMKKFTLKKFLFLVYFLDQAKQKKIIFHDPCLFCRNAIHKESKQILFHFAKELLSGIGDITKHLRPTGYVVSHKQTCLNEFKYGVNNLAVDLRDGVRLTRLMEIILMKENLISGLRTPAISRLQKVHNVGIALKALDSADFKIVGDITDKDIADGHREKTLSLLWQLINKFRAPLFVNAAISIQKWWRHNYLKIWINNRIMEKKSLKRNNAAITIQSWWKGIACRKWVLLKRNNETKACVIIQKNWRMCMARKRFERIKSSTICIQNYYRSYLHICREKRNLQQLKMNNAASKIQLWYRKQKLLADLKLKNVDRAIFLRLKCLVIKMQQLHRSNIAMKEDRNKFSMIKQSAIKIQRFYRSYILMRNIRKQYLTVRCSIIVIQNRFRANRSMIACRTQYLEKCCAATVIQKFYRNTLMMRNTRKRFIELRIASICIQRFYRQLIIMKKDRNTYLKMKHCAIVIQRNFRAYNNEKKSNAARIIQKWYRKLKLVRSLKLKNTDRNSFLNLKASVVKIQSIYRANVFMKKDRHNYIIMKTSVIKIQSFYRSVLTTRIIRSQYLSLRYSSIVLQNRFRAKRLMCACRDDYLQKRNAACTIQLFYKNYLITKSMKTYYLHLKSTTITIQRLYRARLSMKTEREAYLEKKNSAITIQRAFRKYSKSKRNTAAETIQLWYRKIKTLRYLKSKNTERETFLCLKECTIKMQTLYRANIAMRTNRREYIAQRNSAIQIQRFYRAVVHGRNVRRDFLTLKAATIFIQNKFRANNSMLSYRHRYLQNKVAAITVQRFYRNYRMMKTLREHYLLLRGASIFMQRSYRRKILLRNERNAYLNIKKSAIIIQRFYRKRVANKKNNAAIKIQNWYRKAKSHEEFMLNNSEYNYYLRLKASVIKVQNIFKANRAMKKDREMYIEFKASVLKIQRFYRSNILTRDTRDQYLELKSASICIQRRIRANNLMRIFKEDYLQKRWAILTIQQYYRNYLIKKYHRENYLKLLSTTVYLQKLYRANYLMKHDREIYLAKRNSAIAIQRRFKEYILRRKTNAAIKIQNWYRKLKLQQIMEYNERRIFLELKTSVKKMQDLYRANVAMKKEQSYYITLKISTVKIQQFYRSILETRVVRKQYLALKSATCKMQNRLRANNLTKTCRNDFMEKRNSAVVIQRFYKNYLMMKTCREHFLKTYKATVLIQRIYRARLAMLKHRSVFLEKKRSAVIIQSRYRAYREMKTNHVEYTRIRNAALKIQFYFKSYILMKRERLHYLTLKKSIIFMQRQYRLKKYAAEMNKISLREKEKAEFEDYTKIQHNNAALRIQSYWRGYTLRKKQDDNSRIKKLRLRWQNGALNSKQLTLAERNDDAFDVLSRFKDIASVIRAFKTLDFVTDVYPMMYSTKETAGSIARSLIIYMGNTNRSVSALETLHLGVAILTNLTRYKATAHFVYSKNCLHLILSLMMRWCEKDDILSRSFSTLLWLFGKYDDLRKDLSEFLAEEEQYKILCSVRRSILRKKKMKTKKRSSPDNKNSSFVLSTPIKNKNLVQNVLPMTEPDYGITRSSRPKIFKDDLEGIDCVFSRYYLPIV